MAGLHANQENGFDFGIAKDHEDQVETQTLGFAFLHY